jgi:hypothetical protein
MNEMGNSWCAAALLYYPSIYAKDGGSHEKIVVAGCSGCFDDRFGFAYRCARGLANPVRRLNA